MSSVRPTPPTAATAAAASSQTANAKSAATPIPRPLSTPREIFAKNFPSLILTLKLFNRNITKETFYFCNAAEIALAAQSILYLVSAKEKSDLAPSALFKMLSTDREDTESQQTMTENYFRDCGLSAERQKLYNSLFNQIAQLPALEVLKTASVISLLREESLGKMSSSYQQGLLNVLSQLCKEVSCVLFEPLLEGNSKNLHAMADRIKLISENCTAIRSSGLFSSRNCRPLNAFYDNISALTKQLAYYTQKSFPTIKYHCLRLHSDSPDLFHQIDAIESLMEHVYKRITNITTKLKRELAYYEAYLCSLTAAPPQSFLGRQAVSYQVEVKYRMPMMVYTPIFNMTHTFIKSVGEGTMKQEKVSQEQIRRCFARLVSQVKETAGKEKEADKAQNSKIFDAWTTELLQVYPKQHQVVKDIHRKTFAVLHISDFFKINFDLFCDTMVFQLGELQKALEEDPQEEGCKSILYTFNAFLRGLGLAKDRDLKIKLEAIKKGNSTDIPNNSPIAQAAIKEVADMLKIVQVFESSIAVFKHLFPPLISIRKLVSQEKELQERVQADSCMRLLQLEEEREAAQRSYEEQSKKKMQVQDAILTKVAAESPTPPPMEAFVPAPPPHSRAESPFNTSLGKLCFDLRNCIAQTHGMNPADFSLFAPVAGTLPHISQQAAYQEIYAWDSLMTALEMLENCHHASDRTLLIQLVLLFGYIALEQGLTTEYARKFPSSFLQHNLRVLLQGLEIDLKENHWAEHATCQTNYHRYPGNYRQSATLSLGLECVQKADEKSTSEIYGKLSAWIVDAATLKTAFLSKNCPAERLSLLQQMQSVVTAFQASQATVEKEAKAKEQPNLHAQVLDKHAKEIQEALEAFHKHFETQNDSSPEATNAFRNASHHLSNLLRALNLFKHFPQQRFLPLHLHVQLFSAQYFIENLGTYLSIQRQQPLYTHVLTDYDFKMDAEQFEMLRMLNLQKGSEYLYKYYADSPLMLCLNDFHCRAREAVLLGEEARTAGDRKSLAGLQEDLMRWTERFVKLTSALIKQNVDL